MNTPTLSETDRWLKAGRQALVSGTLASALSTAVLAWQGQHRFRKPAAPTNATSHWLWGDEDAYLASEPSLRHTAVGYATHHASAVMWALFYERWLGANENPSIGEIVRDAAGMTAIAAFVDYQLTPPRLRPGFETHLTRGALVGVFAAFGLGLAAGALLNRQHERRLQRALTMPKDWPREELTPQPAPRAVEPDDESQPVAFSASEAPREESRI
jgi:hypothetical protein